MRILLIEDDRLIGESIQQILESKNYKVDWFEDGQSLLIAIKNNKFDVIILDLNLPDISGEKLIRIIRNQKITTPIIIISTRNSIDDKVNILDIGADDFITKPFDSSELIARIKSTHRRHKGIISNILQHDNIAIDIDKKIFLYKNKIIELTPKEYSILLTLIENKNKPISKQHLENLLYSYSDEIESNTIEVHIHNIRKKTYNKIIKTVRGIGYKI